MGTAGAPARCTCFAAACSFNPKHYSIDDTERGEAHSGLGLIDCSYSEEEFDKAKRRELLDFVRTLWRECDQKVNVECLDTFLDFKCGFFKCLH